jgi:hypothetical protein
MDLKSRYIRLLPAEPRMVTPSITTCSVYFGMLNQNVLRLCTPRGGLVGQMIARSFAPG